ncbi:MAG: fluoride efflux transporter CrcB [Ectothiorhodospiraceae bacterium AqS1]|nr:fluoride efflux transporter CrcB [Ectothiorhodospiraceae bacterium AqS1]
MTTSLAIAIGGAIGALLRFWVGQGAAIALGKDFPFGTLIVNVVGCLAAGILWGLLFERYEIAPALRAGIMVGLLGAFTTFSAFSIESVLLIQQGGYARASINVLSNAFLCLAAAWLGMGIARSL